MSHCNQIKLQCLDCGMSVGNPIKHAAISSEVLAAIGEFDYTFRDFKIQERADLQKAEREERNQQWLSGRTTRVAEYQDYLRTPEWREKRRLVIEREDGICQGCRKAMIQEVHHSRYVTRGDELLFQLVGLCSPCHRLSHPEHNES
jgi:5-methylcytosine-specific restriction endonuclease McrA